MSLLEIDGDGESTPQGVVLALVGPEVEGSKDQESLRTLRMYNLASLLSLAKYVVSQKVEKTLSHAWPNIIKSCLTGSPCGDSSTCQMGQSAIPSQETSCS
jgi:hypothetical protein